MYRNLSSLVAKATFILTFFILTLSCTNEQIALKPTSAEEASSIKVRTDLTQGANLVRVEVAEYFHLTEAQVTCCYYHSQTQQGYRYAFCLNGGLPTGSYYLTGIIEDDAEGFLVENDDEGI